MTWFCYLNRDPTKLEKENPQIALRFLSWERKSRAAKNAPELEAVVRERSHLRRSELRRKGCCVSYFSHSFYSLASSWFCGLMYFIFASCFGVCDFVGIFLLIYVIESSLFCWFCFGFDCFRLCLFSPGALELRLILKELVLGCFSWLGDS